MNPLPDTIGNTQWKVPPYFRKIYGGRMWYPAFREGKLIGYCKNRSVDTFITLEKS